MKNSPCAHGTVNRKYTRTLQYKIYAHADNMSTCDVSMVNICSHNSYEPNTAYKYVNIQMLQNSTLNDKA